MSTRSAIGIQHGDRVKGIYSHYDGYPEYNGYILNNFYTDSVVVNKLISMGDVSGLGAEIGEQVPFSDRAEYFKHGGQDVATQCRFYNRDRGEETSWLSFESAKHFAEEYQNWGCEYFYLFRNDRWFVKGRTGRWKLLSRVLKDLNTAKD